MPDVALQAAQQMMARDALGAHAKLELGIDPNDLTSPWRAALASLVSFALGALVPLAAVLLTPRAQAVPVTFVAVVASAGRHGLGISQIVRCAGHGRDVVGGALVRRLSRTAGWQLAQCRRQTTWASRRTLTAESSDPRTSSNVG